MTSDAMPRSDIVAQMIFGPAITATGVGLIAWSVPGAANVIDNLLVET